MGHDVFAGPRGAMMATLIAASMVAGPEAGGLSRPPRRPRRKKDQLAPKETKSAARRRRQIERGTIKVTP